MLGKRLRVWQTHGLEVSDRNTPAASCLIGFRGWSSLISLEKNSLSVKTIWPITGSLVWQTVFPMFVDLKIGPYLSNSRWLLPR